MVRLTWDTGSGPQSTDLPAGSLTNGATPLPLAQMTGYVPGTHILRPVRRDKRNSYPGGAMGLDLRGRGGYLHYYGTGHQQAGISV